MPEPVNGAGGAEFAELRRILVGEDLDQLAAIKKRLDDPAVRAAEEAKVLPGAIRAAHGRSLRDALEPVFERSFQNSVRKHPKEISDAIYPVIGPAIRNSIAAAIREFAESTNQMIEKSASLRSIRWRMEAQATGRPFSEILLTRSLLYSVEQVFLIHRGSGVLLMHLAAKSAVVKDADMVGGMLTAIQDFVTDSFADAGQELETIDVGHYKLWIQYGPKALLVGAVSGTAPVELKDVFQNALDKIHEELFEELDTFKQDDVAVFEPARPYLESCLLGQKNPDRSRRFLPWLASAIVVGLLAFLIFWQLRGQRRWDGYVDALRAQPGIAVTRAEKEGSGGVIEGLKDPKAPDPAQMLSAYHLDPAKVRYEWHPYLSLNTPFAAERDLEADLAFLKSRIIRFEIGNAGLPVAEVAHIEEIAEAINRVRKVKPEARFAITGHTDELGTPEANVKLSLDRATIVSQALASEGIPKSAFDVRGAGNAEPLRTGRGDWDLAANRSVSIHVAGL